MSHSVDRIRRQLSTQRPARRFIVTLILLAGFLVFGTSAWAYWTTSGSGTASATTGTLAPPTGVTVPATNNTGMIVVSWTGSTGIAPQGYYVTRIRNSDSESFAACGSSPTSLQTGVSCTDSAVQDGTFHYIVTAKYYGWTAAGTPSQNVTVILDATAPAVSVTNVNGSVQTFPYLTNANLTSVGGTCGTAVGDSTTVNPLINAAATAPATATCISGNWTLTLTTAQTSDGARTLSATQTDTAGNTGSATTKTVTIDKTPPLVSVTSVNGAARTFPYSTNANVTSIGGVCGTATGDPATVSPLINAAATLPATATCNSGTWTLTLTTPLTTEGTPTLSATQSDTAGNTGTATNQTVTIDKTGPSVALTSVNGSVRTFPYLANANVTSIGGTCGTATGDPATVSPLINAAATLPATATCISGNWTLTLTTPLSTDGASTLSATQTDTAGNTGSATTKTVTIDKTPPLVSVTSVNGAARTFPYTTNANVTSIGGVCGTATGDTATVSPLINAAATLPATATCNSGTWTLTLTTPLAAEGSPTLSATQSDTAGNTGTATNQTVTIDKTPPLASAIATTNAGTVGRPEVNDTVSFTYSELMNPATLYDGWSNAGQADVTNAKITFDDSTGGNGTNKDNDSFTVTVAGHALTVGGGINMDGNVVSSQGGTYSFTAKLHYSEVSSKSVITVTLTSLNTGGSTIGTSAATGKATWAPGSGATDVAGNVFTPGTAVTTVTRPF